MYCNFILTILETNCQEALIGFTIISNKPSLMDINVDNGFNGWNKPSLR